MSATKNEVNRFLHTMYRDATKIPLIGKHVARLGRITDILYQPCGDTPTLIFSFLATAPDAAMFAFATLFKPSGHDYIAARLGRGHKYAPPRGQRRERRELDLYRGLADKFSIPKFTSSNGAYQMALTAFELARRVGWYLTIAEATTAGLLRWVSESYQLAGCYVPPSAFLSAHVKTDSVILFGSAWLVLNQWDSVSAEGYPSAFTGVLGGINRGEWNATFSANAKKPDIPNWPDTIYEFRLRFLPGGDDTHPGSQTNSRRDGDAGEQQTITTSKSTDHPGGPTGVECQYRITGSGVGIMTGGQFSLFNTDKLWQLNPDP